MSKSRKLYICLVFVACLMCAFVCGAAFADNDPAEVEAREVPVFIDGLLSCRGYTFGDITYIPIDTACAVLGFSCESSISQEDAQVILVIEDIEVTVSLKNRCLIANDRCFYLSDGYREIDGFLALPIDIVAKLFTLSMSYDESSGIYDLGTAGMALLKSGEDYYNEEDLYWMSRIISYEAGNQPLEGQIGVGAVVMNRVESDKFENTVKDVIFSPGQFGPVETKAIYLDPYKKCVLVAKMVLEGYNTVGDALYFHQGNYSTKWTTENRYFVTKIGCHNFFESIANLPRV